jgi:hypothetical protein
MERYKERVIMSFAAAGMGMTMGGPAGVLVSLGIEQVVSNLTLVTQYYNYFSLFVIMLLAVVSGQRDAKFISVLMPIWAGFCMFAGWLKYPNMGTGFAILVVCCAIAIMTYMQETIHEKFGIAGPGNKIIKIFMFLIILQCVVVFVNSASIFPVLGPITESSTQYSNIKIDSQFSTINLVGGTGNPVIDILTIAPQMAMAALGLLLKCLLSIVLFSAVISQVFPWIAQAGAIGVAFLVVVQFAIWTMYLLFIYTLFGRPNLDPGW